MTVFSKNLGGMPLSPPGYAYTPLFHAQKQPLYWNWAKLSLQSSLV